MQVPYVSQRYINGNDCELTEDTPDDQNEDASGAATDATAGASGSSSVAAAPGEEQRQEHRKGEQAGGSSGAKVQQRGQHEGAAAAGAGGKAGMGAGAGASGSSSGVPVIKRGTELRVMCSPDTETRAYVVEPRQCRYRVELYVPSLCFMEGFEVEGYSPSSQDGPEPIKLSIKLGP